MESEAAGNAMSQLMQELNKKTQAGSNALKSTQTSRMGVINNIGSSNTRY